MAEGKEVPGVDHIDVTYEGGQIRKLWQNFHNKQGSQESEITKEEMESFHNALRSHASNTIQLCLDDRNIFKLSQVALLHSFQAVFFLCYYLLHTPNLQICIMFFL